MIPGGTPGTKIVKVVFRGIKLRNVIRDPPLFQIDRYKLILRGAAKRPYPPISFSTEVFNNTNTDKNMAVTREVWNTF
jgi:hypothetical protein